MNNEIKLGSLFSGFGGFEIAAKKHGINIVWQSEIEPWAIELLKYHFPTAKQLGDVKEVNGKELEPVDVITFGSPCQDMSTAGRKKGLDGTRSRLFHEAIRIIKEMREATDGEYPKYIIWENVSGALSSSKGQDFKEILEQICKIKHESVYVPMPKRWERAGEIVGDDFSLAWRVLDAQYWGVPQHRERVFIIADFGGQSAGEILFNEESMSEYFRQSEQKGQETSADTGGNADKASELTPLLIENHGHDGRYSIRDTNIVQTLSHHMGTGGG